MELSGWNLWQWLTLFQHEMLLFAGVFFLIGALDDLAVDLTWLWLKVSGRASTQKISRDTFVQQTLNAPVAVFIPTWQEAAVIGATIKHALLSWPQRDLRLYVGCYRNDPATMEAAIGIATKFGRGSDHRLRIVILDRDGPSTKADCLNRLHQAMRDDERRSGELFGAVVFHDAEDMVDPAALGLLDAAIASGADFVQLPVEPVVQPASPMLGSHYCEEFAEAHGKAMVVRSALGAAVPAAGVGCAISRRALHQLSRSRVDGSPFDPDSLTDDYELGLAVAEMGWVSRFLRVRGEDGTLVATRAYFPSRLDHVVRQKTRWVHGICLQGWDRTGWSGGFIETWMRARDRRGPLTALVLLVGYSLLALTMLLWVASQTGLAPQTPMSPLLKLLLAANLAAFVWRAGWRFAFTARNYGWAEGIKAVLRIPVANVIAIMSGRRAVSAYIATLRGERATWDKTPHFAHPVQSEAGPRTA